MERDEAEIEKKVQATNPTTNRLTPSDIDKVIKTKQFYVFPGTTLTVCCLTLENGFNTIGESAAADPLNFNREIGEDVAFQNARQKIWPLEGYLLKQMMYERAYDAENLETIKAAHALKDEPGAY